MKVKTALELLLGFYWIFVVVFAYRRGRRDGRRLGYVEGWCHGRDDERGVVREIRRR